MLSRFPARALRSAVFTRNVSKFGEQLAGPPKLPKEMQQEFENLQRLAHSQSAIDEYNKQIEEKGYADSSVGQSASDVGARTMNFKTIPEFEGDRNPETGEIGGPKQNPLRHNDWSFNGRVTDF